MCVRVINYWNSTCGKVRTIVFLHNLIFVKSITFLSFNAFHVFDVVIEETRIGWGVVEVEIIVHEKL
jgi:hypothetical protein